MNRIIALASPKGGCGSSFVCANLWYSLLGAGHKVLALDMGYENSGLDYALGFQNDYIYTLGDVICGNCTLEEALVTSPKAEQGFYMRADYEYTFQNFDKIRSLLENTDFEYILADVSGISLKELDSHICDTIIYVTEPSEVAVHISESFSKTHMLKEEYIIINKIIPTYIQAGIHLTVDEVMDRMGMRLMGLVPWSCDAELIFKQGVLNRNPQSELTRCFDAISRRITGEYVPANDINTVYDCFKLSKKFVLTNE